MIVYLVNPWGEQLRVQLGSPTMAAIVEYAIAHGWAVKTTV